jgi:zinc protease
VVRVHKELTQANIILGHQGVGREHPDYYAIQVMNYILGGGGFSSRTMDSIRNEKGLAYSVYSHFSAERLRGEFQLVMQTKNETAREAIQIAKEEMSRIREALVSEQELGDAKDFLTGSFPCVWTPIARWQFFGSGRILSTWPGISDRYPDLIRRITRDDVALVARQYLQPEKLITVIVGNLKRSAKNEQLESAGVERTEEILRRGSADMRELLAWQIELTGCADNGETGRGGY